MGFTRRNTLIGLATLAGGAGLIGATGAFTSVEADRTVSVSTAGDASALLQLEGNSSITDTEDDGGVDLLVISNDDINERARTRFDNAITVTNGGTQNVGFYVDGDPSPIGFEVSGHGTIVGESNAIDVDIGSAVDVDIIIDLRPSGVSGSDLEDVNGVTFVADTDAYGN